jgi:Flp pilus assembly protein TadG
VAGCCAVRIPIACGEQEGIPLEILNQIRRGAHSFFKDKGGNVLIVSALSLPVVIGAAGLVAEYGVALVERSENQRVADLAAFSAATAYGRNGSEKEMIAAANRVAMMNQFDSSAISVQLVALPNDASVLAVRVSIVTDKPLFLSQMVSKRMSIDVAAEAYALVAQEHADPTTCILALDASGTGLSLSGGTKVEAEECVASSNATVAVPCGTSIVALEVTYGSMAAPSVPCSGIKGPSNSVAKVTKRHTADPFENNSRVAAAATRVSLAANVKYPPTPTVLSGGNIDFAWNQNGTKNQALAVGCTATWSQPTWKLDCGSKTNVAFGTITMGGGIQLEFNLNGPADATYTFSGPVTVAGSLTRFGKGNYVFSKGFSASGTATFGAGSFSFGVHSGCGYSICNNGGASLTFAGPSSFSVANGIKSSGGTTLVMGEGTGNSFHLGAASGTGYALHAEGGAKVTMADATGGLGRFEVKGDIKADGGSCLSIPAAANHDFSGSLSIAGGLILGAGSYTIDGYFALGESGGGNVNCFGTDLSLDADQVTLVVSGSKQSKSGSCTGRAFCVASGYRNIRLVAPAQGALAGFAVIGPIQATQKAGAAFVEGGSNARVSGVFYFPNGPVDLKGGANALGLADGVSCLQVVGSTITLAGGTAAASECKAAADSAGSAGGKVRLAR